MRRLLGSVLAVAFLGATVAVPVALAQETKWARGTISAVAADSVTLKVNDKEMKFAVDRSTKVIARGAGTKSSEAKAEGQSGPTLAAVLKAGEAAEVQYHEGGAMHAALIRVMASVTPGTSEDAKAAKAETDKAKAMSTSGSVTAVSGTSLTVKTGSGEMTFVIDSTTKAMGTGMGTKAREQAAAGKPTVITDFVSVGDTVNVDYHDGATKHAAAVHVTKKAVK